MIDEARPPATGAERLPPAFSCEKQYQWSNAFVISAVSKFTLRLNAAASEASAASIAKLKTKDQKQRVSRAVSSAEYLRINCVTDVGQNMGSMFVLIAEEKEEHCEYKIVNESENFDMVYRQHFNMASMQPRLVTMSLKSYVDDNVRLKCGHEARFTWTSMLHDKLLSLSFTPKGPGLEEEFLAMGDLT